METSNKLISLGITILIIGVVVVIMTTKSALVPKESKESPNIESLSVEGELKRFKEANKDDLIERNIGKLLSNKLDLEGNHRYILDPSNNDVIVIGKSKHINDIKLLRDSILFDAPILYELTSKVDTASRASRNYKYIDGKVYNRIPEKLFFKVGIKGKQELLILIGHESLVGASDLLELSSLKIIMHGSSQLDAELICDKVDLTARHYSHARLQGNAQSISIMSDDHSLIECGELSSQQVDIMMSNESRVGLNATKEISGLIRHKSYCNNQGNVNDKNVIVKDQAKFDLVKTSN